MELCGVYLPLARFVALRANAPAFDCTEHGGLVDACGGSSSCETVGHGLRAVAKIVALHLRGHWLMNSYLH